MKNLLLIAAILGITFFSGACMRSEKLVGNQFLIEGEVSGVEDGTVIRLFRCNDNIRFINHDRSIFTTDTVKNGRFRFKGETVSNLDWLYIESRGKGFPNMFLDIWVAPRTKVKITGKGKLYPVWDVQSSVPYQKEQNRYTNKSRDLIAEYARVQIEKNNMFENRGSIASEEERLAFNENFESLAVVLDSLWIQQMIAEVDILEETNITTIWLERLRAVVMTLRHNDNALTEYELYDYLRTKAVELYEKMSEKDKNTAYGKEITANLFPPSVVKVGDNMPDADLLDVDGNTKRIADYLGKYLLLDFWNSGCVPCIRALPEMKDILGTYCDKLTIVSISLDSDANWKEAMVKHDIPWVNIRDPKSWNGLALSYGVSGIPNYIMISPEGKIVDKWVGYSTGSLKQKVSENIK